MSGLFARKIGGPRAFSRERTAEPHMPDAASLGLRWYGDKDGTVGFPACDRCQSFLDDNCDGVLAACASVGIEHGRSTGDMVRVYIGLYHARGHREDSAA